MTTLSCGRCLAARNAARVEGYTLTHVYAKEHGNRKLVHFHRSRPGSD